MQAEKEKSKHSSFRFKTLLRLIAFPLTIVAFSFCFLCFYIIFGDEIYGSTGELFTHYPNSELIWSGYGVYGSGDYGSKVYLRWTADEIQIVNAYYQRLPETWQAQVFSVKDLDMNRLSVCNWMGFYANGYSEGCDTLQANLPDYGTLIVFSHLFFAG